MPSKIVVISVVMACANSLACGSSNGVSGADGGGNSTSSSSGGSRGTGNDGGSSGFSGGTSSGSGTTATGNATIKGQAIDVSVGTGFACAPTTGGGVWCWGYNGLGELGNGSMLAIDSPAVPVPVSVTGLTSGVTGLSAQGASSSCAVTAGGGVVCWGTNNCGELGNGSTTGSSVPVEVTGLASGATAVSLGQQAVAPVTGCAVPGGGVGGSACAITAAGGVQCWGDNISGALGNGSKTDSSVPVQVTGLTSGVTAISQGGDTACAILAGGGVQCWGSGGLGQLGNGSMTSSPVPVPVMGLTNGVTAVSVGYRSVCALTAGGGVQCWGAGYSGALGNGSMAISSVPVPVTGLTGGVTAVSVGSASACAVTAGGGVVCWGGNGYGLLGNGSMTNAQQNADSAVPVPVTGLTSGVTAVSVGRSSACAVTAGGGVVCWGQDLAQIGISLVPTPVMGF